MGSGATRSEILEKKLEKRLQDPKTEPLISLPLDFLEDITCGFSTERVLGEGLSGVVYKGVLQSGKAIAVKKIRDEHLLGNQVENEIICLTKVRHQNVVQLLGYCVQTDLEVMEHSGKRVVVEKRACFLCFEFLCNGSLDKHLSDDTLGLDWDIRYGIIKGVCRGLHYLHDECHIVHLDLKPQNILMDATRMPKIADFGLSRLLGEQKSKTVTKSLAGTPGYMAKEYIDKGIISSKADIFSLGVIIIEIITGQRDYPNISERTETSLKHYTNEVVRSWRNRLIETTAMHMSPEMRSQQVQQCISIALKCLEPESNKRPTSLDIVQSLNAVEPKCTSPGYPLSVVEKDRRNRNLQSQVNANIINIPKTISAINGLNECANLFQWVISAISSQKPQNETQKEKLHGDVRQLWGDVQCLSDTLPAMYNLIDRAEWRIHDHYVAELLSRLKDAVYDAEDILDEFRWYETKLLVEGNAISVELVIDFFHSVTQGSFNKVTDIQKRLSHLSGQLEKMGLLQAVPRFEKSFRPETTSFPTEAKIFGRNEEKEKLIEMLGVPTDNSTGPSERKRKRNGICSSESNQICAAIDSAPATVTSVQVLPIVGIGGVGKTTLAQDICNNSKVKCHFKLIIWICVSDDFDVKRLTKEALQQSSTEVPKNDNLNFLQGALADSVNTKRFLIVLDDMWDENGQHWKRFCAPFQNVLPGSMMLVTTRSPKVANVVRTMDPFPLDGLNKDVFQEFFKLCVFGPDSSNNDPELEQTGEKILPKLKGSPLAAKTIGRLLGMSLDLAHWDRILKSQLWELRQEDTDILPALRLSYMYLPPYLKRCFSFCAVYPKDYNFRKKDLAEIWAAEGLVEHRHTGDQYFEELAHLSFFQKGYKPAWNVTNLSFFKEDTYVIHDLMHDMAQLVSKDECFIVNGKNDFPKIPPNVRHMFVLQSGNIQCSDLLKHDMAQHRKLRTLLCDMSLNSETGNTVMEKWCTKLLCMRVMVCSSISKWGLPGSISNMKLLRYLDIRDSSPCKSLPSALCCLYNMQIFFAVKWEIGIPSGFAKLVNLQKFVSENYQFRHIHSSDIHEGATEKDQRRQFELINYNGEYLPHGFHAQNLTNITSLVVDFCYNVKSISFSINTEQIHSYSRNDSTFLSLIDVQIRRCQKLSSLEQFLQPACVTFIKKIDISHCPILEYIPTETFGDMRFLEVLRVFQCPLIKSRQLFVPSLRELHLDNSGNLGYNIECSSLTILELSDYPLEYIELQNLPLLQVVQISSCPYLTIIRVRGEGIFSSLTDIEIRNCHHLSRLEKFLQPAYVPIIKKIKLSRCGSLESVPGHKFEDLCFLEVLHVSGCPKIKSRHLFAPSLKELYLENSGNIGYNIECSSLTIFHFSDFYLESIELQTWNLPLLQELEITSCSSLTNIRDSDLFHGESRSRMGKFPKLTHLTIKLCVRLETIDDLLNLPEIERNSITERGLLSPTANRIRGFPLLKDLAISFCPSLNWQRGMLLPPSLRNLRLSRCGDFSAWFPRCMKNLTSLESLQICYCDCIVSVPEQLWSSNLKSLRSLEFHHCSNLKSIGRPGTIAHIRDLGIYECPELEIDQPLRRGSIVFSRLLP